ncbi:hypothetical protein [Streptomyces sp. NRRL B-24484]|uniref:hypothetical protein n=1 Tax=Streptomyces sp. NRRL B-24484 TaxID=1463833 RepID=UPI0007C42F5E|nr:hypothetical protein [Streptomyces sp. NRRL B-24484]
MAQHHETCPRCGHSTDWRAGLTEEELRGIDRRRRRGLGVLVVCCAALLPWIGFLAATLPVHFEARQWRLAWVGFDLGLLAALAATAWFGWRRRRLLVPWALAAAVLLICDAWFDVMLSWGTDDVWVSVGAALLVELPLATALLLRVRRILQVMLRHYWYLADLPGEPPPLYRAPLLTEGVPDRPRQRPA